MPDRLNKENLKEAVSGDRITLQQWNALIRAVKANPGNGNGYSDEGANVGATKGKYTKPTFAGYNNIGATIPAFSIIGIKTASVMDSALQLTLAKIGATSVCSQLLLATNGSIEVPNSRYCHVEVIDFNSEYLLTCTDAGSVPDIGMPCGVDPDTFTITKDRFGLVCVSLADSDNRVYVKRAQTINVVGCVTAEINPGSTTVLGSGLIDVKYTDIAGERFDAKNPYTGDDWNQRVWNPHNKAFRVGMQVTASDTLGSGLLVDYAETNVLCSGVEVDPPPDILDVGPCCCNELDCLKIAGYDGDIPVNYYEFFAPSFQCYCEPTESASGKIKLYATNDPDIWESTAIQCKSGVASEPCSNTATWTWHEPCDNTATWTWTEIAECTNTITWIWTSSGTCNNCEWIWYYISPGVKAWWLNNDGCSGSLGCGECAASPGIPFVGEFGEPYIEPCPGDSFYWAVQSQTNAGCCTPSEPAFSGTVEDETADTSCTVEATYHWVLTSQTNVDCCTPVEPLTDGTVEGETEDTSCEVLEGYWELTSETNAGCCTPAAPDFDGTTEGQTTTTECNLEEGDNVLSDSFWRLTILGLDYYGCDQTKLEFIIGSDE